MKALSFFVIDFAYSTPFRQPLFRGTVSSIVGQEIMSDWPT